MTPPIRMVSVPVEPTEAMKIAGVHAIDNVQPNDVSMWVTACWSAMLSAAPAPEGGAVERACVVFQEAIDDFEAEVADVMADGSERADLWDREITVNIDALKTVMSAALATREEAPAEAGAFVGAGDADKAKGVYGPLSKDFLISLLADRDAEISALRAQPPAREDAQPVAKPAPFDQGGIGHAMYQAINAYLADYVLSTDGADYEPTPFERDLIEDFFAGLMAEESFFGPIRALYDTHPAPDALRVAVEALEKIKVRAADDGTGSSVFPEIRNIASKALATLQAEQKGGA